jgi:hypothetical protein
MNRHNALLETEMVLPEVHQATEPEVSAPSSEDRLFAALRESGMPGVPERFSVARAHQEIPRAILAEIDAFIRMFDRVTTRSAWQQTVTASGPQIARVQRSEVCFFSAWDFHIPPEQPHHWQLIECNDNGSGFLFAALINHLYCQVSGLGQRRAVEAPAAVSAFAQRVAGMIRREAEAFFGGLPRGLLLILDDAQSLQRGKFQPELILLRDLCRRDGWTAEISSPAETDWDGRQLLWRGQRVSFVVNRSTDFFWEAEVLSSVSAAYHAGSVYIAPNPFTYATRSDKRLLQFLSNPSWDAELGIEPRERTVLSAHVPETHLVRAENVEDLARRRDEFFFKPSHGFASRGLLTGSQVGRVRLRRLIRKGESYVAQRRAPKFRLETTDGVYLWTDLRVWAYRGERFLLSGRASCHPDVLDLTSPGGWLPTYAKA